MSFEFSLNSKPMLAQFASFAQLVQLVHFAQFDKKSKLQMVTKLKVVMYSNVAILLSLEI